MNTGESYSPLNDKQRKENIMIKRMPTRINDRDVHLTPLKITKEPDQELTYDNYWAMIVQMCGDGKWYTMIDTTYLSVVDKNKLFHALVNRIWNAGYTANMLTMRMTEAEGLCFRWLGGKAPSLEEVNRNRAERLESRRVKQRAMRKKAREERKAGLV